jgi:tetratricopeptide (TPR) repeat protein
MTSRLLSRLDTDIRGAPDELAADSLRCERAAYLARLGDFDEALREIGALRQRYGRQPSTTISAWLHLAEALVGHYTDLGPAARDKLARAHALSAAAGLKPLQALSAAWLAHLDYLAMDAPAMVRRATEALSLAEADQHAALARAKLVIAQAYHEGGRYDRAQPWYQQARRHATADGDDATLSAMMWNMASLRVAAWRQRAARGTPTTDSEMHLLLGTESTAHFDAMIGVRSLGALQPILRAQVCALLGRPEEALSLFEAHLDDALRQGMAPVAGLLLADRAWCRLQSRHEAAARADATAAAAALDSPGSACDRAPGHTRLAQVFDALGDAAAARRQQALGAAAWAVLETDQARMITALEAAAFAPG